MYFIPLFLIIPLVIGILCMRLNRKRVFYNFNGNKIEVFRGLYKSYLKVNGTIVDKLSSGSDHAVINLKHKQKDMDIDVKIGSGGLRPSITVKINNTLMQPSKK